MLATGLELMVGLELGLGTVLGLVSGYLMLVLSAPMRLMYFMIYTVCKLQMYYYAPA